MAEFKVQKEGGKGLGGWKWKWGGRLHLLRAPIKWQFAGRPRCD